MGTNCNTCQWAILGQKIVHTKHGALIQAGENNVLCGKPGGIRNLSFVNNDMYCKFRPIGVSFPK